MPMPRDARAMLLTTGVLAMRCCRLLATRCCWLANCADAAATNADGISGDDADAAVDFLPTAVLLVECLDAQAMLLTCER